jgi:fatty-acyl-CoA synthase
MRRWISATTLGDLLDRAADEHADREALVFPAERVTYGELAARAGEMARGLVGLGVGHGDKVGILLPNCVASVAAMFAAAKIGAVPVPVNARFKALELGQVLAHSTMRLLITTSAQPGEPDFPALLREVFPTLAGQQPRVLRVPEAPDLRQIVLVDAAAVPGFLSVDDLSGAAVGTPPELVAERQERVRIRDTAIIMYTSGTTAAPKGAMISHEALTRVADGAAHVCFELTPADRVWCALPLFHIGGIAFAITCIHAGCTYCHVGFFQPEAALHHLVAEHCTVALAAFETIWLAVLNAAGFVTADLGALRLVMAVGVPERLRGMQERVPHAVQVSCFGQTEVSSFLSLSRLDDPLEKRLTTGGHPLPGMEVRVVDPEGRDLPPDTHGEICFRGANAFDGYFRDPAETRRSIDADGWCHTGDLGTMDAEGRVTFVSRIKDMLKVGGENVAAAEVESYLLRHPAVQIVAVVGAPDARYVEVPAAFIELKPGMPATEEEIIEFCRGRIAGYRVPRYVRFVDEWPMSGTKIKKYVLRERIASELAECTGMSMDRQR